MHKGELITGSMKIDKLRNKIIEGEIKIPPFQRAFVWNQEQIIELLDSIYNEYPIGSILLWETNTNLPSKRNIGGFVIPESRAEYPINYVLDGQQRVTTIFGVFCEDLKQEQTDFDAECNLFNIYFDLDSKRFVHEKDRNLSNTNLRLRLLFNNYDFNKEIADTSRYDRDKSRLAVELQSLFQNYELPIVTIKKREKDEVGVIFERINNTGTELSTLDLMIAWTWKEDYHLKEVFDEIYELLNTRNFDNIDSKIILQCMSAIIKETTVTKEILSLNPEDVRNNTDLLIKSLEKAVDYLATQFNVKCDNFLPNSHQLVPITYLFSRTNHLSNEQSKVISKWFWRTSFSNRYSAGTDTKMDEDITFFKEVLSGNYTRSSNYSINVNDKFFKSQTLSKSNSYVKAYLLLLSQIKPRDLTNNNIIDVGHAISSYNIKEYHHIFPKAFLKTSLGLQNGQTNIISNFCFLPASSNKIISDRAPSDYFFNIIPIADRDSILESNLLPKDMNIYTKDNYKKFIDKRVELIMDLITRHIN